jgi:site-specific recombinase XerC
MYVERRYNRFMAFHDIPAEVRPAFGNRRRFAASLATDSHAEAKQRAAVLEARWRADIQRARSELTDPVERSAWMIKHARPEDRAFYERILATSSLVREWKMATDPDYAAKETQKQKDRERLHGLVSGKLVCTDERLEEYLATLTYERKTLDQKRGAIKAFAAEHRYTADVTRRAVQQWVDKHSKAGHATSTIRRNVCEVRGLWTYLQSLQIVGDDELPFERLVWPKAPKSAKRDQRRAFAASEVVALHGGALEGGDQALADLIEVAALTGARLEEVAALRAEKVHPDHIEIEDAKTAAGWRQVPIHTALRATLARLRQASTDGFLLRLTADKYGDRSNAIGKRFGNLKTRHGFGPQLVFHSIRKTVATAFENAGVAEGVAADILGHKKTTMTYGLYSGGSSLAVKQEAIEKLRYPGLPS